MPTLKAVFFNGDRIAAPQPVLFELGLAEGQEINEEQMREIISRTAANVINDAKLRRATGEENAPDTSELEEALRKFLDR